MASRSLKVRQVFAELRHALGGEFPAGELLRLAAALVDASYPGTGRGDESAFEARAAGDHVPLDKAFADGGWRVLEGEPGWKASYWDDDPRFPLSKSNVMKVELAA